MNQNRQMNLKEWVLVGILSVLWGTSFFLIKIAIKEFSTATIVFYRLLLAVIFLSIYSITMKYQWPRDAKTWFQMGVMGLLNNILPFSLIIWGQQYIDSGLASILNATTPIFSVILTYFFVTSETLTTNRLVGTIIGWIGVANLIGFEALKGINANFFAQIAILGAAFCYASAAIYGKRIKGYKPSVISSGMLFIATLIISPYALIYQGLPEFHFSSPGFISMTVLAIFCTALAYLIYFNVLATAGPNNLLLVTFLIPIGAVTIGTLVLHERLTWNAIVGMILIMMGMSAIDGRLWKKVCKIKKFEKLTGSND